MRYNKKNFRFLLKVKLPMWQLIRIKRMPTLLCLLLPLKQHFVTTAIYQDIRLLKNVHLCVLKKFPGLAPHKFYKRDYCRQYLNMKAKRQQNGTWVESKTRAYNANIVSPSTLPDPSEMSKLTTAMETFTTMFKSNVSKNTRILIDSGCNSNIIASPLHSDTPIIHRESKDGISTANGQIIPILGKGTVLNIPADFVPSFVDSLLSVSQMTELKNSCFIFFKDVAYEISLTSSIINLLTQIHTLAVNENLILCTAPLTTDKLYAVDTNNKNTIPSFAASTYYQTAKFDNVHDLVKYFHETWSHASLDLMVNIFTNLPTSLTKTAILNLLHMGKN